MQTSNPSNCLSVIKDHGVIYGTRAKNPKNVKRNGQRDRVCDRNGTLRRTRAIVDRKNGTPRRNRAIVGSSLCDRDNGTLRRTHANFGSFEGRSDIRPSPFPSVPDPPPPRSPVAEIDMCPVAKTDRSPVVKTEVSLVAKTEVSSPNCDLQNELSERKAKDKCLKF